MNPAPILVVTRRRCIIIEDMKVLERKWMINSMGRHGWSEAHQIWPKKKCQQCGKQEGDLYGGFCSYACMMEFHGV